MRLSKPDAGGAVLLVVASRQKLESFLVEKESDNTRRNPEDSLL
jgi:hypothetical protein